MTISRVKSGGWTEELDSLTAQELDSLDNNLVKAIDGDGGGTYSPTNPIIIGGAGIQINRLGDSVLSGNFQFSGDNACMRWRYSTFTGTADVTIGVEYDEWHSVDTFDNNRTVTLRSATGSPLPSAGNKIRVRLRHTTDWDVNFEREDTTTLATFDAQGGNNTAWFEFMYTGTVWITSGWGTDGAVITVNA